ncbi:MAG: hypothetical protein HC780_21640 [Leptolyngbyaceae cyanobacterium CSU_1_3]|nr:hypothetical protein [Leptolyngbyaceae cyanobacterium CSU_1_3]
MPVCLLGCDVAFENAAEEASRGSVAAFGAALSQSPIRGPLHLSTGQEAVAVGVCLNLERSDYVTSTHRGHGHTLANGHCKTRTLRHTGCHNNGRAIGMSGSILSPELSATIVDPHAYQDGEAVDAAFAQIRRDMPFARTAESEYDSFWVVSRHADVMEIERRADIFQNSPRATVVSPKESEAVVRFLTGGEANLIRSLVSVDGAEHKALRGVVFPAMTPQAVRKLEDEVRLIARDYAAQMLAMAPECDFAEDISFWYPLRVIMMLLGVPPEDEPFMLKMTQEIFGPGDPDVAAQTAHQGGHRRVLVFGAISRSI